MNPVYSGLVAGLTFIGLLIFVASGQPMHLTVTFVIVTMALGLGAAYILSREQAEETMDEGEDASEGAVD